MVNKSFKSFDIWAYYKLVVLEVIGEVMLSRVGITQGALRWCARELDAWPTYLYKWWRQKMNGLIYVVG